MIIKGARQVGKTWLVREYARQFGSFVDMLKTVAEVDYVIEKDGEICPLEVKDGTSGSMKSMHLFLTEKKGSHGIKVSRLGFSDDGTVVTIPFYALEVLVCKERLT